MKPDNVVKCAVSKLAILALPQPLLKPSSGRLPAVNFCWHAHVESVFGVHPAIALLEPNLVLIRREVLRLKLG